MGRCGECWESGLRTESDLEAARLTSYSGQPSGLYFELMLSMDSLETRVLKVLYCFWGLIGCFMP